LEADGKQLKFAGPRKAAALLAYLLLHERQRIDRQALAFTLWPDDDEDAARAALRRHLYLVTRALPEAGKEPWIAADATTVGWNPLAPAVVDVARFRALSADEAGLAEAAALYAGDLLAAFDDEWIVDERDRFRQRHTENLERLIAKCRESGDSAGAIRYAQELLRLDPWREDAIRHVIALRSELGDRSGALAEFERFAQRLREDLDVEPMPETIAVYTSIVKRSAPIAPPPPLAPPAFSAPPHPSDVLPFTGREGPLQALMQAWSRAVRGRGNLIAIGGEAGLGKTRLIEEFAKRVEAGGGSAFIGETSFIEAAPYQPFVDVLRKAAPRIEAAGLERIWLDALATLLPERIGDDETRAPSAPLDAPAERRRLFEAIVAALALLANQAPVLLVIEDLHWAGAGTISLLEHLARRLAEARVLIVATYREEETLRSHPLRELRRRLQKEGRIVKLSLGPLSFDDVREILEDTTSAAADATLASRFFTATDGHPLFLSELVREIAGGGPAADAGELDVANLPGSVTAAIDVRLGRLSEAARSLAESASVVGRGFDIELLSESSGLGAAEIEAGIEELLEGNIVRESGARGQSFNFTHQLFQTRAYERIPRALRAERHLRVAHAIEELYPDRHLELATELANHFEAAGEGDRAAACYLLAARRALDLYANEDAVAHAASGLALSPALATVLELLLTREEGFGRLGRRQEQGEDLERLAALAGAGAPAEIACEILHRSIAFAIATSDRERERAAIAQLAACAASERWRARAQLAHGSHLLGAGHFAEAGPILEEALRRFDELHDMAGIVGAALEIVRLYRNERNYEGVRAMLARAEECLDDRPETRFVRVRLLEQQIIVEMRAQRYRAMAPLAEKLLELSTAIGHVEGEALAYRFLGGSAAWQLNVVRARDFLERAARLFEKIGNRLQSYSVLAESGIMSNLVGRFGDAEAALTEAMQAASDLEYGFGVATCYVNLADAYNRSGHFERSRAACEKALELWKSLGTEGSLASTLVNLGVAQRGCGDEELALATFERAAAQLGPEAGAQISAEVQSQLALSQLRTGRTQACAETMARLLPLLDAAATSEFVPEVYAAVVAVLRGIGRSCEADAIALRGHAVMAKRLRAIPDDESRRAFSDVAVHKELLDFVPGGVEGRFSDSLALEST
jgi:DNA-binding SARP family transcriptional activator/tetratricopeptide (TPR) repeat protein